MAALIMAARGNQDVDLPRKMAAICWQKIAIAGDSMSLPPPPPLPSALDS